ncbi:MAG TPA: ROK family protein, partial [Victivallales bacterium]|nr:ROK family protein [Victivallales bacterium]
DVIKDMINSAKNMLCDCSISESDISAIGIGAPGPADLQKGILLASPNMKKWDNIHLKDIISENFKSKVYFDNDANAGALAEWLFGVGQGRKNIIYLTMSTGIGGGIISEGVLLRGRNLLAGELGHVVLNPKGPACNCGLRGCYEAYCGGKAISQRILSDLSGQPDHPIMKIAANDKSKIGYPALIEAVKLKNGYALSLWDEICLRNSQAIGIFINIFNPEMIIMGTIAVAAGNLLIEPLKKLLPRFAWTQMMKDIELKTTSLGNKIGEYSGISIAKYYSESADSH